VIPSTLEILQGGRDHLADPARWHKGNYFNRTWAMANLDPEDTSCAEAVQAGCPACAIGSLCAKTGILIHDWMDAPTGSSEVSANQAAAIYALKRALPRGQYFVPDYNDDPKTTHADILALFDRAIAAVQAEGTPA
jgi:hypothetical protein